MKTLVQAHVCYRLMYHIVWIPKYRYKVLKSGVKEYCKEVIESQIIERYPDVVMEEINVMEDHIHMVVVIPPKYSVSKVVGDIKRDSSREMRKRFEFLKRGRDAMWSIGYFVSSVGLDEKRIRNYVIYQGQQDSGQLEAVWDKKLRVER